MVSAAAMQLGAQSIKDGGSRGLKILTSDGDDVIVQSLPAGGWHQLAPDLSGAEEHKTAAIHYSADDHRLCILQKDVDWLHHTAGEEILKSVVAN